MEYLYNGQWFEVQIKAVDTIPVGAIINYPSLTAPYGYLLCDGRAVSRTEYADLFAVYGTQFGAGDGSTTFNLPDYSGRTGVGIDENDSDFNAIGKTLGSKYLQEHYHEGLGIADATFSAWSASGSGNIFDASTLFKTGEPNNNRFTSGTVSGQTTGNSGNIQPSIVSAYYVKYEQSVGVVANVHNESNSSEQDVYSCEYINGKIIDSSSSNYIKFEDGTCMVWGVYDTTITLPGGSGTTIICNLPITMKDTNYIPTISKKDGGNGFSYLIDNVGTKGTTSFNVNIWNNSGGEANVLGYYWQVMGKWK